LRNQQKIPYGNAGLNRIIFPIFVSSGYSYKNLWPGLNPEELGILLYIQAVLDFWTFDFCTTHTSVHYKFASLICLLYTKYGLSYIANKQSFWVITQWHCLPAKPQSWQRYNLCPCRSVHLILLTTYFKQHIMPLQLVLPVVMYSFHLSSYTWNLQFPSV